MKTNHELLGRPWPSDWVPFSEALGFTGNTLETYKRAPNADQREAAFESILNFVAFQHLGYGAVPRLREQVEMGVDLAVDYFCGDWWTPKGIDRLAPEEKAKYLLHDPKQLENRILRNAEALDKSHPARQLVWFDALLVGLFLGGLLGRWDDVARVCSWFDATIEPEFTAGTIESQFFQWHVCVACSLNPQPVEGVDELLEQVRNCRLKRTRLLGEAWQTVLAADQTAFDKAFTESIKHFVANPDRITVVHKWVALPQSIMWLIAEHRGLRLPPLRDKCLAAIVTRHSLGFGD